MATYYLPDTTGWVNGAYALRLKVSTSFSTATGKTTVAVTPQAKVTATTLTGEFYCSPTDAAYLTIDGNKISFTGNEDRFNFTDANIWVDMIHSGTAFSAQVSGAKNVEIAVNYLRIYKGSSYSTWQGVSGSVPVAPPTYTLSISAGTGCVITVKRGSTTLSNGAAVSYGDVLTVSFSVTSGYTLLTHTVNGANFPSGGSHTVTGAVAVAATASVKAFTLSIQQGTGTTVTVRRTSSPKGGGATGVITGSNPIFYDDVLEISVSANSGYVLKTATLNGGAITTPYTVKSAVSVAASAIVAGVYLDTGSGYSVYQVFIDTGSAWAVYMPMIDTGNTWEGY